MSAIEDAQVVEGTAETHERTVALVPAVPQPVALTVTPSVTAHELGERLRVIRDAADHAMTEGVDYGKIPGTDKPTLLKPGAEKLSVLFQLDVQLVNEKEWGPGDHLTVVSRATVFYAPNGARLGYGEGICSTRERKYAYRQQQRVCPTCGKEAIIKGKAEYGGGWVCFKKRGGCNAKFPDGFEPIEGQQVGEVENPDLPDLWNTVMKMAEKRARVDAVLAVTGASALFTQDLDDVAASVEREADVSPVQAGPPYGPPADKPAAARASGALTSLFMGDQRYARELWGQVKQRCGGYMPAIVAELLVVVAEAATAPVDPGSPEVQ